MRQCTPRPLAVALICALLALSAAALVGISMFEYETVQNLLGGFIGLDSVDSYLPLNAFTLLVKRLRLAALALILLAVPVWSARVRLQSAVRDGTRVLRLSVAKEWTRTRRDLRSYDGCSRWALAAIVGAGLLVRLHFSTLPMCYDEAHTYMVYARKPLLLALASYTEPNNHLFNTLLVWISTHLFGSDPWAIRLPAFLAGALLPVVAYWLARWLAGPSSGLYTAVLAAVSSVMVLYSNNGRGYTLSALLTAILFIASIPIRRRASPAWFLAWAAAAVLALYTIPSNVFAVVASEAWILLGFHKRSRRFRRLCLLRSLVASAASAACVLVLYSPVLIASGPGSIVANRYVQRREWDRFISDNLTQFGMFWDYLRADMPVWLSYMIPISGLAWLIGAKRSRRTRSCILVAASVSLAFLLGCRFVPPARTWLIWYPLYATACGAGIGWLINGLLCRNRRSPVRETLVAGLLCAVLSSALLRAEWIARSPETGGFPLAREIADYLIDKGIEPERLVLHPVLDVPIRYYWWKRMGRVYNAARPNLSSYFNSGHPVWRLIDERSSEYNVSVKGAAEEKVEHRFEHYVLYRVIPRSPGK